MLSLNLIQHPGISTSVTSGVPQTPIGLPALGGILSGGAANGGFVLYPSKPNINMLNSVYAK